MALTKAKAAKMRDAFDFISRAIYEIESIKWGAKSDDFETAIFHLEQAREALRRTN
jgi:HEPN domain-containing protein